MPKKRGHQRKRQSHCSNCEKQLSSGWVATACRTDMLYVEYSQNFTTNHAFPIQTSHACVVVVEAYRFRNVSIRTKQWQRPSTYHTSVPHLGAADYSDIGLLVASKATAATDADTVVEDCPQKDGRSIV